MKLWKQVNGIVKTDVQPAEMQYMTSYFPKGCPFYNYDLWDLLSDFIKMYSWKMENGRRYDILEFLDLCCDEKANTYKPAYEALATVKSGAILRNGGNKK